MSSPLPPAPTGARWLDLVATTRQSYGPSRVELLTDRAALEVWLRHEGLTPARPPDDDDVVTLTELREHLRALGLAAAGVRAATAESVDALNAAMARDEPPRLDTALALAPPATVTVAAARLAREAATDVTGERVRQLRTCGDDVCAMLYLDATGRRRWCSAEACGVRHRVRAHRQRAGG